MTGQSRAPGPAAAASLRLEDLAVDPYPRLAELRSQGAAVWAPNLGMWVVAGYDDTVSVLRDPERFTNDSPKSLIQATFGRQMLSVEGEEQKRYKQACLAPFTGKASREVWQPRVDRLCGRLLEASEQAAWNHGASVDLMADYAAPIALETMGIVVGLPSDDLPRVRAWYEVFARSLANFEGDVELHRAGQEAAAAMREYLAEKLDEQRPAGETESGTLIEVLSGPGGTLARSEALANLLIVLFGGIETTESMIGNALHYLLSEPGLLEAVLDSQNEGKAAFLAAVEDVMEESLRYDPAVQTLTRHTTGPVRIGGAKIAVGETVQCMVGGANRDPAVFEDPESFQPGRANVRKHLAFGLGNHFCLGAQLARAETRSALRSLLERWPGVSLDRASSLPPYGHEFRKPGRLVVRPHSTESRPKRITVRRRSGLSELSQTASHSPDPSADGSSSSVG
ncbi:MAG: cytochrome P450 [Holophagales bacterium]|nr:cytochrome P450 [Holophagales bacterium]MYJ26663.1 cytochrome P450 [Holophagales bacterium]